MTNKTPAQKRPKGVKTKVTKAAPVPAPITAMTMEMVTYCPLTFATGASLANRLPRHIPYPAPITRPLETVVVVEVVRNMGDRVPVQFAIPVDRLWRILPECGRGVVTLVTDPETTTVTA